MFTDVSEVFAVASNEEVDVITSNLHADTLTEKLVNIVLNKAVVYSGNAE